MLAHWLWSGMIYIYICDVSIFILYIYYFYFYLNHSYFRAVPPAQCIERPEENSVGELPPVSQIQIFFILCPVLNSLLPPAACLQSRATPHLPAHLFIEPCDKLNGRVGLDWKQLQQKNPLPSRQTVVGKQFWVTGEDEIMPHKMVFVLKWMFIII